MHRNEAMDRLRASSYYISTLDDEWHRPGGRMLGSLQSAIDDLYGRHVDLWEGNRRSEDSEV